MTTLAILCENNKKTPNHLHIVENQGFDNNLDSFRG